MDREEHCLLYFPLKREEARKKKSNEIYIMKYWKIRTLN